MTRDEFIMVLAEKNIDPIIVCFAENIKDGYCIRKNYFRWETLVRERGQEYDVRGFLGERCIRACEKISVNTDLL